MKVKTNLKNIFFVIYFAAFFCSCDNKSNHHVYKDTATSGEVLILCDESYQPLMAVQADTFMGLYTRAKLRIKYLPEYEMFQELMRNDSVRIAITARELTQNEAAFFRNKKIFPKITKIAVDGIAVVLNKENVDTLLSYQQINDIFSGKIKSWKTLNPKNIADSITIVFDKNGSANINYLQTRFLNGMPLPSNFYATNSNSEIVNYVANNINSLGVISVNWISDKDSPSANQFLSQIKVAAISAENIQQWPGEYFKPYQGFIALKQYPFRRDVLIISREGRTGLGTGFASFLAGDLGQRIIRLMGMLPATMPVRLVNIN